MGGLRQYIGSHWRGETPLAHAYWVNTAGVNFALGFVLLILGAIVSESPLWVVPYVVGALWLSALVIQVWQSVGVFRSALQQVEKTDALGLPVLALIGMLVIWCNSSLAFMNSGRPQLADAWRILNGDQNLPEPVVTVLPSGIEAEFSGGIRVGSAAKLRVVLDSHPGIKVLHLQTVGGRGREAEEMATMVRQRGLNTYVAEQCESAGTFVFLAGKERTLQRNAKIGFHSAKAAGIPMDQANRRQERMLKAAGADSRFIENVVTTSPYSMWYPTAQDLLDQGLATRISDGRGFGLGTAALRKYDAAGLEADLLGTERFRALKKVAPESFATGIAEAVLSLRKGSDMPTALAGVMELYRQEIQRAMPCVSDKALEAFTDYLLEVIRRNGAKAPKETLATILGRAVQSSPAEPRLRVPDNPKEAEDRLLAAIMESPRVPRLKMGDTETGTLLGFALGAAMQGKKRIHFPLREIPGDRAEQLAACETWERVLVALKGMPPEERQNLSWFLFQNYFGLR